MPLQHRRRPGSTPQEEGRRYESFWAKLFGTTPTRGSGNQWFAPLDVGDVAFLFSCKWTGSESFRVSKDLITEVVQAINAPGGRGGDTIPGLAFAIDEGAEVLVTLRAEDLLRLLKTGDFKYLVPSKGEQKRARARVPGLLRDDE